MQNLGLLAMLLFITVAVFLLVQRAKGGKIPKIRRLAALEAIEEGVGRATEMDKPVLFTLSCESGLFGGRGAAGPLAGLEVLAHVAKLTARKEAKLKFASNNSEIAILGEDVIRTAYAATGKEENFNSREMVWPVLSGWKEAISGYLMRERPAANIMMGDISTEAAIFPDIGAIIGAMNIAGCQRETQIPILVAFCDYTLVGEELLVAGAYLRGSPDVLGSVQGQDMAKYFTMVLTLLGAFLTTAGMPVVGNFFKL